MKEPRTLAKYTKANRKGGDKAAMNCTHSNPDKSRANRWHLPVRRVLARLAQASTQTGAVRDSPGSRVASVAAWHFLAPFGTIWPFLAPVLGARRELVEG